MLKIISTQKERNIYLRKGGIDLLEEFEVTINEGGKTIKFFVHAASKEQADSIGLSAYGHLRKQNGYVKKADIRIKKIGYSPYKSPCAFDEKRQYALPKKGENKFKFRVSPCN